MADEHQRLKLTVRGDDRREGLEAEAADRAGLFDEAVAQSQSFGDDLRGLAGAN